jgi:hypothetical protein
MIPNQTTHNLGLNMSLGPKSQALIMHGLKGNGADQIGMIILNDGTKTDD